MGQIRIWSHKRGEYRVLGKYFPERGDLVEMTIAPLPSTLEPDYRPLEVVFETDDFLVINKDPGINSHPTASPEGKKGTLVNQLIAQVQGFQRDVGEDRPGIIHRLDKDTSGLMIVAKNDLYLRRIQKLIHDHEVKKTYLALVIGIPKNTTGTILSDIGRDPHERTKMTTKNPIEARKAVTHYTLRQSWEILGPHKKPLQLSLLEVTLETGRTHQIRVHMSTIGHPILGDMTYGDISANTWAAAYFGLERQFLHAWKLAFELDGQAYVFEGPLKNDLVKTLTLLG